MPLMASRRLRGPPRLGNLRRFARYRVRREAGDRAAHPIPPTGKNGTSREKKRERGGENEKESKREREQKRQQEREREKRDERFSRSIGSTYGSERARPGMPADRPGAVYMSARSIDAIDRPTESPYFRRTSSPTRARADRISRLAAPQSVRPVSRDSLPRGLSAACGRLRFSLALSVSLLSAHSFLGPDRRGFNFRRGTSM